MCLCLGGIEPATDQISRNQSMSIKTQILIYIVILAVFDTVIPLPLTALVLIYVVYLKPRWFREWVDNIYHP